jgi:Protein of unknown function (DUF3892)
MSTVATETRKVTCISMHVGMFGHEGISLLRGDDWIMTRTQVISAIENQGWIFYTADAFSNVAIIKVNGQNGNKFVQTWADGIWANNLLALPRCI